MAILNFRFNCPWFTPISQGLSSPGTWNSNSEPWLHRQCLRAAAKKSTFFQEFFVNKEGVGGVPKHTKMCFFKLIWGGALALLELVKAHSQKEEALASVRRDSRAWRSRGEEERRDGNFCCQKWKFCYFQCLMRARWSRKYSQCPNKPNSES